MKRKTTRGARKPANGPQRYANIIEKIFLDRYRKGQKVVEFSRQDLIDTSNELGIALPKNIGDVLYSFRYRRKLPAPIASTCPPNHTWSIFSVGISKYRFKLGREIALVPRDDFQQIKILDSTPEIIRRYALSDEQALLAIVRYNRLIDIFTGVTAYSLQNHLRTTVSGVGQIEVDELYIGVNKRGTQFVMPVQAKGHGDRLGIVQISQDVAFCRDRFPLLIARPIAVQFMADGAVAMMEVSFDDEHAKVVEERHYRLVSSHELSDEELADLRARE